MGKIIKLDEPLANKIAAGEVVERPASIVKELVENSLDAGATKVQVDVEEGGLSKIKITDNGHGIAPEDCRIAFERHATSKISEESDLFHIRTLGFRGEALPSIASVSHVELKTGTGDGPGSHLILQGGHVIQQGHTDSRRGTEITVRNLFYNTPARLKHLKTIHTELGNITDTMNKLALAHPDVRFHLTHNHKTLLNTNGKSDLRQVIAAIYGMQTAKLSLPFSGESLDFKIYGRIVKPEITRAGRQYVYILINSRYIKNYPIFNAIINGCHTLLPIGRYPIAVIHIEMDPTLIDVNVHPAKLEARISKEKELCGLIEKTIKETFHKERLIPAVKKTDKPERLKSDQQMFDFSEPLFSQRQPAKDSELKTVSHDQQTDALNATDNHAGEESGSAHYEEPRHTQEVIREPGHHPETAETEKLSLNNEITVHHNDQVIPPADEPEPAAPEEATQDPALVSPNKKRMPKLYPIGQMHGTYIFAQNEDGLYIIDQHAAQERIKYEFFREKVAQTEHEVQECLVPITFEFTAKEYAIIEEYHDYLKKLGLDFEPFGQHSFIVRSHPTWFPKGKEKETIEDIVQQLLENNHVSIKKLREKLAIMMSCKKSIKANQYLRDDEIEALLEQLRLAEDPFTCPHGRPVIVHFSSYEMEKLFKRVM
ncbi:DNA mismatch repair protein MutL [Scopulibacillus daqui]|uniref:DNA mismatch repair protein MutL n=1 Tax=Scopulibacillus daqui TaxID=1469162 RepID=A0ABS2PXJ2_9BACL|nr:DNA mismatch repair endonuclease MutL [Scopulibacillus daqui]MBM7644425.1 DNA mismatch repair protein MutL [Scopulibacillus daqui]